MSVSTICGSPVHALELTGCANSAKICHSTKDLRHKNLLQAHSSESSIWRRNTETKIRERMQDDIVETKFDPRSDIDVRIGDRLYK